MTACGACNLSKGDKMPTPRGFMPIVKPEQPSTYLLQENGRAFPPNYLHDSWRDFLYWDSELEQDEFETHPGF